ncbi:hypothetical protein AOLI_G00144640 [Acnodon oligacanthus]
MSAQSQKVDKIITITITIIITITITICRKFSSGAPTWRAGADLVTKADPKRRAPPSSPMLHHTLTV